MNALPVITDQEFAVIDGLMVAYMACNDSPAHEWEITPNAHTLTVGTFTAMGCVALAGRAAWREAGITDGTDMWGEMIRSGIDARTAFRHYVENGL